jgi:hypothetical protein
MPHDEKIYNFYFYFKMNFKTQNEYTKVMNNDPFTFLSKWVSKQNKSKNCISLLDSNFQVNQELCFFNLQRLPTVKIKHTHTSKADKHE